MKNSKSQPKPTMKPLKKNPGMMEPIKKNLPKPLKPLKKNPGMITPIKPYKPMTPIKKK